MGLQNERGASEILPLQNGRGGKSYAEGRGGGATSFEAVLTCELKVLAILKRGATCYYPLKRDWGGGGGGRTITLSLEVGG